MHRRVGLAAKMWAKSMMSLRSRFDPSLLGGRRRMVQLTLLLMLLSALLGLAFAWQGNVAGLPWQSAVPAGVMVVLLLLGQWRGLSLERWGLLCLLAFVVAAIRDMLPALLGQHLPLGLSLWTPLVLLECFVVFGASYGTVLVSVLGALLVAGFAVYPPVGVGLLQAWFQLMLSCVMFCVLGYGISRFLEQSGQESVYTFRALHRARLDMLTQVLGRAAIEQELHLACERAQRQRMPLSLIVCDIDYFKKVNDTHGHARGDEVLRGVARKLRQHVANIGASVGRWGGEEFVIVVPGYARTEAVTLAEHIRQDIASSPVTGLNITLSLGVASYRMNEKVEALFERADKAVYASKHAGRNRVSS